MRGCDTIWENTCKRHLWPFHPIWIDRYNCDILIHTINTINMQNMIRNFSSHYLCTQTDRKTTTTSWNQLMRYTSQSFYFVLKNQKNLTKLNALTSLRQSQDRNLNEGKLWILYDFYILKTTCNRQWASICVGHIKMLWFTHCNKTKQNKKRLSYLGIIYDSITYS